MRNIALGNTNANWPHSPLLDTLTINNNARLSNTFRRQRSQCSQTSSTQTLITGSTNRPSTLTANNNNSNDHTNN